MGNYVRDTLKDTGGLLEQFHALFLSLSLSLSHTHTHMAMHTKEKHD